MSVQVTKVTDLGDDRLEVRGTIEGLYAIDPLTGQSSDELAEFVAFGWVSAMEQHYDPSSYDQAGNLKAKARAHKMTKDEQQAYWVQLLSDAAGTPRTRVLFEQRT